MAARPSGGRREQDYGGPPQLDASTTCPPPDSRPVPTLASASGIDESDDCVGTTRTLVPKGNRCGRRHWMCREPPTRGHDVHPNGGSHGHRRHLDRSDQPRQCSRPLPTAPAGMPRGSPEHLPPARRPQSQRPANVSGGCTRCPAHRAQRPRCADRRSGWQLQPLPRRPPHEVRPWLRHSGNSPSGQPPPPPSVGGWYGTVTLGSCSAAAVVTLLERRVRRKARTTSAARVRWHVSTKWD